MGKSKRMYGKNFRTDLGKHGRKWRTNLAFVTKCNCVAHRLGPTKHQFQFSHNTKHQLQFGEWIGTISVFDSLQPLTLSKMTSRATVSGISSELVVRFFTGVDTFFL